MLHRANVEALSEHAARVRGMKGFEIELRGIEARTLRDGLTAIEHMLLSVSSGRRKHKLAVRAPGVLLKFGNEFCRSGDLPLLPAFGVEPKFRFGGYAHGLQLEIDVAPEEIHHFLLAESGQQKGREQHALRIVAGFEELPQVVFAVFLGKGCDPLR